MATNYLTSSGSTWSVLSFVEYQTMMAPTHTLALLLTDVYSQPQITYGHGEDRASEVSEPLCHISCSVTLHIPSEPL